MQHSSFRQGDSGPQNGILPGQRDVVALLSRCCRVVVASAAAV
ncbi:hypothetical protein [Rhodanobacter lindaniclasticus]